MTRCSYCGKENEDGSVECGHCGSAFNGTANRQTASQTPEAAARAYGEKLMNRGLIWFVGGCVVTIASYSIALGKAYSGEYVIAYGAIIWGAVQYLRGRSYATGRVNSKSAAQELLDAAAHYESIDRAKALALYEEIARTYPDTRAGKEAERSVQTLRSFSGREESV